MITLYRPRFQRGRGFGSIFKLVSKFLLPLAKRVVAPAAKKAVRSIAKTAKRKAIRAGLDAATNILSGNETPKQALIKQGKKFKRDMTTKVVRDLSTEKTRRRKQKPRPSYKDIYD